MKIINKIDEFVFSNEKLLGDFKFYESMGNKLIQIECYIELDDDNVYNIINGNQSEFLEAFEYFLTFGSENFIAKGSCRE
jgi:hypothetical protein